MDWFLYDNDLRHERVNRSLNDVKDQINLERQALLLEFKRKGIA